MCLKGDVNNAELNLMFNSDLKGKNTMELIEFIKLFVAYHTGVPFVEFILAENKNLGLNMVLKKLRLSYIRKRCDWMGGPEKYPFSTYLYWSNNSKASTFGRLMMWFFLIFDYQYFKPLVENLMEVDQRFVKFVQSAVDRYGFFIQEMKSRDSTRYYHFLLSPLSKVDVMKNALVMFQRVCYFYHFPHDDVHLSGTNINISRIILLSR